MFSGRARALAVQPLAKLEEVAPGEPFVSWLAQKIGGMKHRHHRHHAPVRQLQLAPAPAQSHDAVLRAQKGARRGCAEADEDARAHQLDLAQREGQAGFGFRRRRCTVAGRAPEHRIGDPHVVAPDADGGEHAVQELARLADEGLARDVLLAAWRLSHHHHLRRVRPVAEHEGLGGGLQETALEALQKRGEIYEILDSFKTKEPGKTPEELAAEHDAEKAAYYPVSIFCPECHTDFTTITHLSEDCTEADYTCRCGHSGHFNFLTNFDCKLGWKVDWPMRWRYEGVDFEPGGKDHAAPSGSYSNARLISKQVFGYEAPLFQGYEFIGIRGMTGKMSSSSGLNLTPGTLLKLYEPEIILWLYAKTEPTKAFDFCFDDGILRQYFEFDRMYADYAAGKSDEHNAAIMENCIIEGRHPESVPMGLLVQLGSIVDFNVPMLETVFAKIGTPYRYEQFAGRLDRARFWLEQCSPENANKLCAYRNWDVYETLSDTEKEEIRLLHETIAAGGFDLDGLNALLYAIPKRVHGDGLDEKALKALQGTFFKNVYRLLLNKEKGPRLYLFLYAIDTARYLPLLDFSYPKTAEEEAAKSAAEQPEEAPAVVYGEPDPVEPVKPEITLDDFAKIDLRVCKVIKCSEIRKSHSCLKLTLFDGEGERVIVSSIKHEYTPEQLIGKKIIVIANLKPARLTGVTSQGMLLAATNNACGCKVLFVDDSVPEGTPVR